VPNAGVPPGWDAIEGGERVPGLHDRMATGCGIPLDHQLAAGDGGILEVDVVVAAPPDGDWRGSHADPQTAIRAINDDQLRGRLFH
jgi:hypothetical protein